MSKQIEALKLALEALVAAYKGQDKAGQVTEAITAIRKLEEALADSALERIAENERELGLDYMEPGQPASKPLTDAQIGAVAADIWGSVLIAPQSYQAFARAIEAAHGIKE